MKVLIKTICLLLVALSSLAQKDTLNKKPSLGIHFFYNDFATPQLIKSNGFSNVVKNKQWNKPFRMQGGLGFDYLHGIKPKIDLIVTLNASWVNYLIPPTFTPFGSSHLMLDVNAGSNLKLFTDKRVVSPYLITKVGFSNFKSQKGFNLIPGLGIQFHIFKEIYVNSTIEYRYPISNNLSPQYYYSFGIARNISLKKKKVTIPTKKEEPSLVVPEVLALNKNIVIILNDETTGLPLEYAEVTLKGDNGNVFTLNTNQDGKAIFKEIPKDKYVISGRLNKINASTENIEIEDFIKKGNQLEFTLTHNDPRFTLVGNTVDKNANKPVGNTVVTVTNVSQKSTTFITSRESDGEFRSQLEANSEFTIVGKKASYISNIENVSTLGLNRSATLYVKLQLGIEEAKAGKTIVLNKIFFATGKSDLNTSTSKDLQKLIQFMIDNPSAKLEIQGHTDNVGSLNSNIKLSQDRANSVVLFLTENGINKNRLSALGYGPNKPIASNTSIEGKAQNRRVEMKVIE